MSNTTAHVSRLGRSNGSTVGRVVTGTTAALLGMIGEFIHMCMFPRQIQKGKHTPLHQEIEALPVQKAQTNP